MFLMQEILNIISPNLLSIGFKYATQDMGVLSAKIVFTKNGIETLIAYFKMIRHIFRDASSVWCC